MTTSQASELVQQAVLAALVIGAPIMIVGMLVGILVSLTQTLFQIQDTTVATVLKLAAVAFALVMLLPWMTDFLVAFSRQAILSIPSHVASQE